VVLSVLPVKPADWMYTVPLLGQQIGITELLRGGHVSGMQIAICLACGFVVALLVALLAAQVYRSERLAISA
jgi:sodium transport system permease protein